MDKARSPFYNDFNKITKRGTSAVATLPQCKCNNYPCRAHHLYIGSFFYIYIMYVMYHFSREAKSVRMPIQRNLAQQR